MTGKKSTISFHINTGLKRSADKLFGELGMNMTTAINIFLRQAIRADGMPFRISANELEKSKEVVTKPTKMMRITAVEPLDNYRLLLTFDVREDRIYDMTYWLDKPHFEALEDLVFFKTVRIGSMSQTVEWDGERTLCPDMLYEDSVPVTSEFEDN